MESHASSVFSLEQPLVQVEQGMVKKFGGDGALVSEEVSQFLLGELLFEIQRHGSAYGSLKGTRRAWLLTALLSNLLTRFSPKPGELIEGEPPKYKARATSARCEQQLNGVMNCYTYDFKLDKSLPSAVLVVVQGGRDESKWPDCMYQALSQAGMAAAIRNSSANRLRKVHCLVLGDGWWGCAEIHPLGYVMVKPGSRISSSSVEEFRCQLESKGTIKSGSAKLLWESFQRYPDKKSLLVELEERVRLRTEEVARALNARLVFDKIVHSEEIERTFSPVIEKRRLLLVGAIVCDSMVYESSILSFPVARKVSAHDKLLVSGLLRMFSGNRVLHWTLPGIQRLVATRDKELEEKVDAVLMP